MAALSEARLRGSISPVPQVDDTLLRCTVIFPSVTGVGHERRTGPTLCRQVDPRQRTPSAARVASGSGQFLPPALQNEVGPTQSARGARRQVLQSFRTRWKQCTLTHGQAGCLD
jgi:hypothetical protein